MWEFVELEDYSATRSRAFTCLSNRRSSRLQILFHRGRGSLPSDEAYISVGPDQERCFRCDAVALPDMFFPSVQLPLPQRRIAAAEDLIAGYGGIVRARICICFGRELQESEMGTSQEIK